MKFLASSLLLAISLVSAACDAQSEIAKKSVEKYQTTPTPQSTAAPEEPINPADVVTADTSQEGPKLVVKKITDKTDLNCDKYNRVTINVTDMTLSIKGVCKEVMVNGDRNRVTLSAASTIVSNGYANTIQYVKYANGKRPFTKDNGGTSTIEKITEAPVAKK